MASLPGTYAWHSWHIRMAQTCTKNDKGQADHCLTEIKVDNERNFRNIYRQHLPATFAGNIYRQHLQATSTGNIYRQHL